MPNPTNAELEQWTQETHRLMEQAGVTKTPRAQVRVLRERGAKRCPGCSTVKRVSEFAAKKNTSDGLQPRCRSCSSVDYRKYYRADPKAQVERVTKYRETNPLTVRITNGRIRAQEYGVPYDDFNRDDLVSYWDSIGIDPWVSAYSGTPLSPGNYSMDHIVPLSQPGSPGHVMSNLLPCTKDENRAKRHGHFIDLLATVHADSLPVVIL